MPCRAGCIAAGRSLPPRVDPRGGELSEPLGPQNRGDLEHFRVRDAGAGSVGLTGGRAAPCEAIHRRRRRRPGGPGLMLEAVNAIGFAGYLRGRGAVCQAPEVMLRRRTGPRSLASLGLLAWALAAGDVQAAPFAGTGHASIGGKTDGLQARGQALERARRAALEAALEQIGPAEPAARKKILDEAAVWTRSYRVLQQGDDGATASATVSVEIDTARLSKALALPAPPTASEAPALVAVREEGCAEGSAEALAQRLVAAGLVRDGRGGTVSGASARTLELRCRELGPVRYPHGVVVEAALALRGGADASATALGFGADAAAATAEATAKLYGQVAPAMSAQTGAGLRLRLAAPWPAARVRRLERAIAESVIGVQSVRVASIGGDGSVTLKIDGTLSAAELHERLAAVQVPGATLVALEVEAPDVVRARLQ